MARFFSMRVAPGVRLSTSSRGLRAHVGPRMTRLHVGSGRSGVSTGAGPFTWYEQLPATSGAKPTQRVMEPTQLPDDADQIRGQLENLRTTHRQEFAPRDRSIATLEPLPWFSVLLNAAEKEALKSVSRFDRTARSAVREHARSVAEHQAANLLQKSLADQADRQREADELHASAHSSDDERLLGVLRTVIAATRQGRLQVNNVVDGVAHAVVYMDANAMVPIRKPVLSAAGNWTLPKVTKTERSTWVRELAAAYALLAAKETQAVAPGLRATSVAVADVSKKGRPVLRTTLAQAALARADWQSTAWEILTAIDPAFEARPHGRTGELLPLGSAERQ